MISMVFKQSKVPPNVKSSAEMATANRIPKMLRGLFFLNIGGGLESDYLLLKKFIVLSSPIELKERIASLMILNRASSAFASSSFQGERT